MSNDRYTSPLSERYASREMQYIFSPDKKFKTWRRLWIALAEAENELGLLDENGNPAVTKEQIEELKSQADNINYDVARERERSRFVMMLCHMYMLTVFSVRRQRESFIWELPPVMSEIIPMSSL